MSRAGVRGFALMSDGSGRAAWKFARLYAVGVDGGGCSSLGDGLCSAPAYAPRHVVRDFATAKVGRWQGMKGLPRFPQKLSVAHATNFSGPELWK